jgi:hypothetical protein
MVITFRLVFLFQAYKWCKIPRYKLRPSDMPMNILRNRADIFKNPDVLSYKHFSYVDLRIFYDTARVSGYVINSRMTADEMTTISEDLHLLLRVFGRDRIAHSMYWLG